MADQNNNLPEGTDKVIPGASGSSGPGAGSRGPGTGSPDDDMVVVVTETEVVGFVAEPGSTGGTGGTGGGGFGGTGGTGGNDQGSGVMDKLRSGSDKLSGQAADKAKGFVSQGLERSADALTNVSRMINDTAEGIDERLGQEYGDYARRAAAAVESTANSLAKKDPEELIDDTRNFVRKSPGVALAGAAVVGFAVARLIKSGLAGSDRDDDGDDRDQRPGRTGGPTGA